jgi:hypothetical protein
MSTTYVNRTRLAEELGLTDRRIRQMVAQHLLPEPWPELGYDLERCERYYGLYQRKDEPQAWIAFLRQIEEAALTVQRLIDRALKPRGTKEQLKAASLALQALSADMRFVTAARSGGESERSFFEQWWSEKEDQNMGLLFGRAVQIMAEEAGTTAAEVERQLRADSTAA